MERPRRGLKNARLLFGSKIETNEDARRTFTTVGAATYIPYVSAHSILDAVVVPGDMLKILLLSFVRCVKPAHSFMYLVVNLLPYSANRAPTQQASCGTCGGKGCSGRGNGQNSCCTKNIAANGETCSSIDIPNSSSRD